MSPSSGSKQSGCLHPECGDGSPSETSTVPFQLSQYHNLVDFNYNEHCCENIRSHSWMTGKSSSYVSSRNPLNG